MILIASLLLMLRLSFVLAKRVASSHKDLYSFIEHIDSDAFKETQHTNTDYTSETVTNAHGPRYALHRHYLSIISQPEQTQSPAAHTIQVPLHVLPTKHPRPPSLNTAPSHGLYSAPHTRELPTALVHAYMRSKWLLFEACTF